MELKAAKRLVKALIFKSPAALACRPAATEVAALAYAVVASVRGFRGVPHDMVEQIAEANAARYISQWLGC